MSSFALNKKMIFDDREPPCFDRKIKKLMTYQYQIYKDIAIVKATIIFSFTFDLIKISLTQNLI